MTSNQKAVLAAVLVATWAGGWFRARRHGERVTLASLYHNRLCERRAWRGREGEADAAYEYQAAPAVLSVAAEAGLSPKARENPTS